MSRRLVWVVVWLTVWFAGAQAQSGDAFTVAVLPPRLTDNVGGALGDTMVTALERALAHVGLVVLPRAQVWSAVGDAAPNFNPTCIEAQAMGARVGSAGYVLAALQRGERSTTDRRTVIGGTLHLFAVETRTGRLLASEHLDFIEDRGGFLAAIAPLVEAAAARFAERWRTAQAQLAAAAGRDEINSTAIDLRTGDIPPGVTPPVPQTRIRPKPTDAARSAGVVATVSVEVVVTEGGDVGEVTIVRWAGYGLEAAVEAALRATHFKPATCYGKPVAARFLVDFNFRAASQADRVQSRPHCVAVDQRQRETPAPTGRTRFLKCAVCPVSAGR
ncbi:MAG: energy transducer TonB [Chloracidobacterium sp.]|nr:energy transducer TonB [Chloracidobacterium sp.]MDW8216143.1 energy transducer TonB [Acidobacteriota bacterium]